MSDALGKKATIAVLLPKPLRAEWVDAMALDPKLSDNAFRVACVIGSYFNKFRADAYPSVETIAKKMKASTRTVWAGVAESEARGYLIVTRRQLGTYTRKEKSGKETRVRLAGGKGVSNTYQPAFERSQIYATNTKSKLAEICDLYWSQRSQISASKVATDCDLTLTSSSSKRKNPSRAREPSRPDGLGSAGAVLLQRIGDDHYHDWFREARVLSDDSSVVTIEVPTKFFRIKIEELYLDKLVEAWRVNRPETASIKIVVRASGIGASQKVQERSSEPIVAPQLRHGGTAPPDEPLGELMARRQSEVS